MSGDGFDGCAGLKNVESYSEWLKFKERLKKLYGESYVPSEVYLAVRENDGRVVGIIDYRHPLSDFLFKFGGNIGYSVRPSERRKGYATQMLRDALAECRKLGLDKVMVSCRDDNEGSRRTILGNGGKYECAVHEPDAGINLERYWISLD